MLFLIVSIIYIIIFNDHSHVESVWTDFNLIRPYPAWGSDRTTPYVKINQFNNNGPNLTANSKFGSSITVIGDLDNNGYDDLAVGASDESWNNGIDTFASTGSVYILFMSADVSVLSYVKIACLENGGPQLNALDQFGYSIAALGDFDGDSIPDIVVGAPEKTGIVRSFKLIRGYYGSIPPPVNTTIQSYEVNGPPIRYNSRFGTALTSIGDINFDGVTDIAVSALDVGSGGGNVYIMFMRADGIVIDYTTISANKNGGPDIPEVFTGFGSALLTIPDFDNDNISELVIGAKDMYEPGSNYPYSGQQYVCYLSSNGTIRHYEVIGESSLLNVKNQNKKLPYVTNDACGSSLGFIGDINKDQNKQHSRSGALHYPSRKSIPDFVMGCPQAGTAVLPGTIMLMFLTELGSLAGFDLIPSKRYDIDRHVSPPLKPLAQFGWSLAGYQDIDQNGIREIIVGAIGDDDSGINSGAIYILFLRRRRFHPIPFDMVAFVLKITIPTVFCCSSCIFGIYYFFWYFRRKPDEIEIIVKQSGYTLAGSRKRYVKSGQVGVIEYTV